MMSKIDDVLAERQPTAHKLIFSAVQAKLLQIRIVKFRSYSIALKVYYILLLFPNVSRLIFFSPNLTTRLIQKIGYGLLY